MIVTPCRIDVDQVDRAGIPVRGGLRLSPELFEKSLGRTIHDPDILYSEQAEVDPCDFTQFGVALDCDDLSEPFAQVKGIDAQPAGQIQAGVSRISFDGSRFFAAALLEGERRQDAQCSVVRGEFDARAL